MRQTHPLDTLATDDESGWTRRFVAFGKRLEEATHLYEQLGYEVRLESASPANAETAGADACQSCLALSFAKVIYTRQRRQVSTAR